MLNAESIRADFPILQRQVNGKRLIYFDNAATTHKPRQVLNTVEEFYGRYNANIHRSPHTLGMEATELYEQAHDNVARFIGAEDGGEIVFVRNCTEAINLVAYSFIFGAGERCRLKAGDEVVVTVMEHHSNLVPWQVACARTGATLRVVDICDDGALNLDMLATMVNKRTKLVCCTHVSNVLGTINPIAEIASIAQQAGALLLVDGAQSVPHMAVHVQQIGCDFLAFSGHKMLAPMGIGVLYGRRELLQEMSPFLCGGDMISEVTLEGATWNKLPWKFEAGTANVCGAIALGGCTDVHSGLRLEGAMDYLQRIGMTEVRAHGKRLTQRAIDGLRSMPGTTIYGPRDPELQTSVIAFAVDKGDAHLIATLLNDEGIAVRSGGHCAYPLATRLGVDGTVRVSSYVYNTVAEVDSFLQVLDDIVRHRLL